MSFPHQPDQLTAAWLTDTLREAGVLHAAHAVSFEVKPFAETAGLLGQNMIVRLAYDMPEDTAPQSIFAKFALADAEKRAGWRTSYVQEVRFYQQFAQQVALPTPRAYFAEFDEETGHFLLLLEDCSYGETGDRLTGCSLDRARQAVAEIATFHATWSRGGCGDRPGAGSARPTLVGGRRTGWPGWEDGKLSTVNCQWSIGN